MIKTFDFDNDDFLLLGVTATPNRRDGKLLNEILGKCTFRLTIEEMIGKGQLSDIEGFCVKTKIDISSVDDHNGDFSVGQLYNKLCIHSRNQMIIELCEKEMTERKTMIFCININHSKEINRLLNDRGISCSHIDGKMNSTERNSILTAFRNGEISVLCNCQLLTEGFDEPSINGIILARPTKSRSLFVQMVGRGLRLYPGKVNCKVIDIVDNHRKLAGFNSMTEDGEKMCNGDFNELESFKSFKDINEHLGKERLRLAEFSIEKIDIFFKNNNFDDFATESMIEYLRNENITYFEPLSFDEGSFLIWFDKLKKEFYGINN